LYDVKNDPHEVQNLVNNNECKTTLEALRKRCDELRDSVGGPFVKREKPAKPSQKRARKNERKKQ